MQDEYDIIIVILSSHDWHTPVNSIIYDSFSRAAFFVLVLNLKADKVNFDRTRVVLLCFISLRLIENRDKNKF